MKKQLKLLITVNSIFVFAMQMFTPLYALFVQKIEAATYHISGIWSFYILSAGIMIFLISKYENKKKNAPLFMAIGYALRGIGWFAYIFAGSLWQLYAIQIFMALGEALGTPTYNLMYSSYLTRGHFASDWGIDKGIFCMVVAAASFSGGLIVYFFGFTWLLSIMVALSIISTITLIIHRRKFYGLFDL